MTKHQSSAGAKIINHKQKLAEITTVCLQHHNNAAGVAGVDDDNAMIKSVFACSNKQMNRIFVWT